MIFKKNLSINLFLSYFFIIMIIISLGYFCYEKTFIYMKEKNNEYNQRLLKYMNDDLEEYISKIEQASFQIYNSEVQKILNNLDTIKTTNSWEYIDLKSRLFKSINSIMYLYDLKSLITNVFFIKPDGTYYEKRHGILNPDYDFSNSDIYKNAVNNTNNITFLITNNNDYLLKNNKEKSLLLSRKINNTLKLNQNLGVFVLEINWDIIEDKIREQIKNEQSDILIVDKQKNILFNSNTNKDFNLKDIDGQLINYYPSKLTNWTFINILSTSTIHNEIYYIKYITTILALLTILVSTMITVIFSRSIIKPINLLNAFTRQVEKGNLDKKIYLSTYCEINTLAESYNHMTTKLKKMIENNYILEIKQKESEIKSLQAQINPHFLYNTLNSINAYAEIYDAPEISQIIYAISNILHYNIGNNNKFVKIKDEIDLVKNYLYIQNVRFNNEIHISYDIDESIYDFKCIKFIFQPLVENALYHGLELKSTDKKLKIKGYKEKDIFIFEVIDNGVGIDEPKLYELNNSINSTISITSEKANSKHFSIGLRNVNQRLKLICGKKYGLKIISHLGEGTKIIIELPILEK